MCKNLFGGGGGYTPPPDNSLEVERLQQEERARNAAAAAEREAADKAARGAAWWDNANNAINSFRNTAGKRLEDRGLSWSDYGSRVEDLMGNILSGADRNSDNPGALFTTDRLDAMLNDVQSGKRARLTRDVNNTFTPGRENTVFADTADDTFIDSILGRQREDAVRGLDMAKARGNLTDYGYSRAMTELDGMAKSGRATAQTLGASVLDDYRTRLRGVGDEARTAAGSYDLGGNFDLGNYTSRYDTLANDLTGRLEGDVTSALSGQQFFDLGDIITRGGAAQGGQNAAMNLDFLAERDRTRNTNRGVGTTGQF